MEIDLNFTLNIERDTPIGLRVQYICDILCQLKNLPNIVDSTTTNLYKSECTNCLLEMVAHIEKDEISLAIETYDMCLPDIQISKESYFTAYGDYFEYQYSPPSI